TLRTSSTNIASAIRTALGALPPDRARRIVLLSDGNQNVEQAQSAAALAGAAGVPIDTVPLVQNVGARALVAALQAPAHVNQGDRFSATVQVRATASMSGTLRLLIDGQLAATQTVQLDAGANRFVVPLDALTVGHHVLNVVMETTGDSQPENKTAGAYVIVDGPPHVLIVEGAPGEGQYLAQALTAAGLSVDVAAVQSAPLQLDQLASYAGVVLANVPADAMSVDQMKAIESYVQVHGGGLVVSGGDHAYAPGGYGRTPLEDILPVSMDLRGSNLSPSTALVLAIDTSGSMSESIAGQTIIEAAKQSALAAAQVLGSADRIGVIAFQAPASYWVQPLTSAADTDVIGSAISGMEANAGDDSIEGVLQLAYGGLGGSHAAAKHVILLTDGETPSGNYQAVAQEMQAQGITISTIGLGNQINVPLLQDVARLGNGTYAEGNDLWNLPQLVVKQTRDVRRTAIVDQQTNPVVAASDSSLTDVGVDQAPPLLGYVATTPKPQSTVVLATPQGDPLLAEWQFGIGRVAAWTSDATNRWAADWLTWPGFETFWAQLVKRTLRPADDPERQVTATLTGDQVQLTLDARSGIDSGEPAYVNFLKVGAQVVGPDGQTQSVEMPQVAPGEYQATVPSPTDGVYAVEVNETAADGSAESQSSGYVVPYSPEYRDLGTNDTFLAGLAAQSGGRPIV
ncbi:MAG: VWA domain-containing protein, partial [Chloroflexi bacterium]|nr:VWA domain-containing protein [Chloroflexota bacterium]